MAPTVRPKDRQMSQPKIKVSREGAIHVSSNAVSRQHLRIYREGDDVLVRDLSTRNGTQMRGINLAGELSGTRTNTAPPLSRVLGRGAVSSVGRGQGDVSSCHETSVECDNAHLETRGAQVNNESRVRATDHHRSTGTA